MAVTTIHQGGKGQASGERDEQLFLVVWGPNLATTHRLVPGSVLLVGRAEDAEVRVIDPQASRYHARITVGTEVEVEDLESANGTLLRDRRLDPGRRVVVSPGEAVSIGDTVLLLQRRAPSHQSRKIESHGYFESRLVEECARAENDGVKFALLRLRFRGEDAAEKGGALVLGWVRPGDIVARYGPVDFEVLLVDSASEEIQALLLKIQRAFAEEGLWLRVGVAFFPRDGASPQVLMAHAAREVAGTSVLADRPGVIVRSAAVRALYETAERAAASAISVLILGETGVGKEVLAQTIHEKSPRALGRFVCLSCAALAESLLESELFGHERGAFTGAVGARPGLFEAAHGGTLFLDEVGEMSLGLQAKLLRALETRTVTRVGGTEARPVDVRFVAATNRDLEAEVAAHRFREDLYFRIAAMTLTLPPLRERTDEIEPLARMFLEAAAVGLNRPAPVLSSEAIRLLVGYSFPGNVRELRNIMDRALVLCSGTQVEAEHLPAEKVQRRPSSPSPVVVEARGADSDPEGWRARHEAAERQAILDALARCAGNQSRAAELLGMPRRTFCDRLKAYGIPRPRG